METVDHRIPDSLFTEFVSLMPQVSVELVVEDDGDYLLARRVQEPARGEWFWPGSRLFKGEPFDEAVDRVAREELGVGVDVCCQLGAYSHFWETDAFDAVDAKHTVNVVYHVGLADDRSALALDDQHDAVRFVSGPDDDDRDHDDLHPYVRQYLKDLIACH
jgi:colanic acid biosynthesis protein WcaH